MNDEHQHKAKGVGVEPQNGLQALYISFHQTTRG